MQKPYGNKEENMDKSVLNKYKKPEDKLLLSKILDKITFCTTKNQIQVTHFLDLAQQEFLKKFLVEQKQKNYLFFGGFAEAERKMLLFYPEKLESIMQKQENVFKEWIKVIHILLPTDLQGKLEHRNYLGACMKLGLKREWIGDILVDNQGADIFVQKDSLKFLLANLPNLTRFQKAQIEEIPLTHVKEVKIQKEEFTITVSSMRLDTIVAELAKCSRSKAMDFLMQEKVLINFETCTKATKEIKLNDRITIRGKGRFFLKEKIGDTKKGKIILKVEQ